MNDRDKWESIDINQFPEFEETWVKRILGLKDWETSDRDIEKVEEEYDKDKYKSLLDEFTGRDGPVSLSEVKWEQIGSRTNTSAVSRNGELFQTSNYESITLKNNLIYSNIDSVLSGGEIIIELGSGYGYNLGMLKRKLEHAYPGLKYIGGEYSGNAVELGNIIFEDEEDIQINEFNYYSENWDSVRSGHTGIILFTAHSIEQLPDVDSIMKNQMRDFSKYVDHALHFEPIYEMHSDHTMLGCLRRRYTQLNDYNRDLQRSLRSSPYVEIMEEEYDLIGTNPLNPTSLIRWTPTAL